MRVHRSEDACLRTRCDDLADANFSRRRRQRRRSRPPRVLARSARAAAQQRLTQGDILRFDPLGTLTILHVTDIHAQLVPLYFREPSINLGVGEAKGQPPHLTDAEFRAQFKIATGSADAFALTSDDFVALAQTLRPDGRARSHRHARQGDPRRARRRQGAAARWRRHLAGQLDLAADQGPGHGRRHVRARRPTR